MRVSGQLARAEASYQRPTRRHCRLRRCPGAAAALTAAGQTRERSRSSLTTTRGAGTSARYSTSVEHAYRHRLPLPGRARSDGTGRFANRPALLAAVLPDGPTTADVKLPASASWSIFHQLNPKWDLMADITWTDWSTLNVLNIDRANGTLFTSTPLEWEDTWRFSAGANYHHSGEWTFRFGVAFDQTPVHDADRTPRASGRRPHWVAIGAQYRMSKQAAFDFGYAHLFVKDSTINLCTAAAGRGASHCSLRDKNNSRLGNGY